MTRKWPSYLIIHFLELYEQRPCLWDQKSPMYKNRHLRDEALQEIVEAMSEYVRKFDVGMAKAKIRSIRNAYLAELHKVMRSSKNAESSDDIYTPTVPWYPAADRFLKYVVETKDSGNSQESRDIERLHMPGDNLTFDASILSEAALGNSTVRSPAVPNQSHEDSQQVTKKLNNLVHQVDSPKRLKLVNVTDTVTKAVNSLHRAVNTLQQTTVNTSSVPVLYDEFEAFAKIVAAHLRALPISTALDCQADILNYLVEQRRNTLPQTAAVMTTTTSTMTTSTATAMTT